MLPKLPTIIEDLETADLDHDGDQDVFEQMGGALLGDKYVNVLYENPGFGNRWITVSHVGRVSNRNGIGARIRVEVSGHQGNRVIYKHVNSGGSFGANPLRQTIGLGNAVRIDRLEIYWPTSHRTHFFTNVPLGRLIVIDENASSISVRSLPPCPFQWDGLSQPEFSDQASVRTFL